MNEIAWVVSVIGRAVGRAMAWTVAPVEDEQQPSNVIPMPGPAHGPVPAIELRMEQQRRKAS